VSETLAGRGKDRPPCQFIPHGSRKELLASYGLDAQGIAQEYAAA